MIIVLLCVRGIAILLPSRLTVPHLRYYSNVDRWQQFSLTLSTWLHYSKYCGHFCVCGCVWTARSTFACEYVCAWKCVRPCLFLLTGSITCSSGTNGVVVSTCPTLTNDLFSPSTASCLPKVLKWQWCRYSVSQPEQLWGFQKVCKHGHPQVHLCLHTHTHKINTQCQD